MKDQNSIKVSVVIPAYNAEDTLRATLESVLRQTIAPHEILVMDDGSTDHTRTILDSYGSRLKVFSQKNQGVAESRNVLCRAATGDIIAFIDSDDIWHPSYLEIQSRLVNEYPEAAATFVGHIDFLSEDKLSWEPQGDLQNAKVEVFPSRNFLNQYVRKPGNFYPSFLDAETIGRQALLLSSSRRLLFLHTPSIDRSHGFPSRQNRSLSASSRVPFFSPIASRRVDSSSA